MNTNLKSEYLFKITGSQIPDFPLWQVLTIPARQKGLKGQNNIINMVNK
jgi:hypothetical protein